MSVYLNPTSHRKDVGGSLLGELHCEDDQKELDSDAGLEEESNELDETGHTMAGGNTTR
jgi:hypothetical protein